MTTTLTPAVSDCIDAVTSTFSSVFGQIDVWRGSIHDLAEAEAGIVTVDAIDELVEHLVLAELSSPSSLIIGAGFVARPGYLQDSRWHLAWWLGKANTFGVGADAPSVRRLEAEEDDESENFRDYTALEWWRVPTVSGAPHITGPYVDYLCTDEYTLSLTVPVEHGGTMIGVVGTDLYVEDIERTLLPRVRAIGGATILNASRRVVVSADPHRPTGSIMRESKNETVLACGDTSLLLVVDQLGD
ncbi:MAG: cache domain-containing protein [Rhodoglobus sp.]